MIKAGADVNAKSDEGVTPLQRAAMYGDPRIINAFIQAGADVDAKDSVGGTTPLMIAAGENFTPEMVITLLKLGADPKAKDRKGRMAIYYASEMLQQNTDVFRILKEASYAAEADHGGKFSFQLNEFIYSPNDDAEFRSIPYVNLSPTIFLTLFTNIARFVITASRTKQYC
jgi:ankyrin repeat protein